MIDKETYFKIKHHIRLLSKPQLRKLIEDMELNDREASLLLATYDEQTCTKICMDNFMCETSYRENMKCIYSKIKHYYDYIDFTNF